MQLGVVTPRRPVGARPPPTQPCRTDRPFLQQNPMLANQSRAMSQLAAVPGVHRRVRNLTPEEHPAFYPAR